MARAQLLAYCFALLRPAGGRASVRPSASATRRNGKRGRKKQPTDRGPRGTGPRLDGREPTVSAGAEA